MSDDHERSRILAKQTEVSGLIEKVYEQMKNEDPEAPETWAEIANQIWPMIDGIIEDLGLDHKPTEDKVDRSFDKPYDLNDVLADADVALAFAKKHEDRLAFNRHILETFDMTNERNQYFSARQAIAESLNGLKRYEECDSWLKSWKKENEKEVYPDFVMLKCLAEREGCEERMRQFADSYMAEKEIDAPSEDVMMLYEMIALIYERLGETALQKEAEERMNS